MQYQCTTTYEDAINAPPFQTDEEIELDRARCEAEAEKLAARFRNAGLNKLPRVVGEAMKQRDGDVVAYLSRPEPDPYDESGFSGSAPMTPLAQAEFSCNDAYNSGDVDAYRIACVSLHAAALIAAAAIAVPRAAMLAVIAVLCRGVALRASRLTVAVTRTVADAAGRLEGSLHVVHICVLPARVSATLVAPRYQPGAGT